MDTSLGRLAFVRETTPGITPATPAFKTLDFTSEGLVKTKNVIRSAAVSGGRLVKGARQTSQQTAGPIAGELVRGPEMDEILAAVLGNAFAGSPGSANAGGSVVDTFTFERKLTDTALREYTGARINSIELGFTPEQFATYSLGIIGASSVTRATPITGATYATPSTNEKLTSLDLASLAITGGVTGSFDFESLTITLDNNQEPSKRLGPNPTRKIRAGQAVVTVQASIFVDDNALSDAWDAGTSFALGVQAVNGGIGYGFALPKLVMTAYDDSNGGNGGEFIARITADAVMDATLLQSLIVSKIG